jgi:hypothetical protein
VLAKEFAEIMAPVTRVQVFEEREYAAIKSVIAGPRSIVRRWRPPSATCEECSMVWLKTRAGARRRGFFGHFYGVRGGVKVSARGCSDVAGGKQVE